MWGKRQFSLRAIFIVMILVAHACAKPHFAKNLHPSGSPSVVTTIYPLHITIGYEDDDGSTSHEETFVGLLGMYWLTSRTSYSYCRCCFGNPMNKSEGDLSSDEIQKLIQELDLRIENEEGQNVD